METYATEEPRARARRSSRAPLRNQVPTAPPPTEATALPALPKAAERTTSCTSLTSPLVSKSATANTAELPFEERASLVGADVAALLGTPEGEAVSDAGWLLLLLCHHHRVYL